MAAELSRLPAGGSCSCWRELKVDRYALQATGKGEAFASALARLANQNLADADLETWVGWLLSSHPALAPADCDGKGWKRINRKWQLFGFIDQH